ncbi:MAG: TetR family transcriptional regulator [Streptosporangiales bacterium]|nr:TetR family transcriptional regulator [Streptosporangiales bacterium]
MASAAAVFARLGYAQSTLEDVATEVGINRATLYYYVGTKEELLVALLDQPIDTMRSRLEEIAAQPDSARDKLAQALREYVQTMVEKPELFIFLSENVHKVMSGPEAERIRSNADRYGRMLGQVIDDGMRAGEFRDDIEPATAVLGILGMFNWIHRWYDPSGPRPLTDFGDTFIEMALSALEPSKRRKR